MTNAISTTSIQNSKNTEKKSSRIKTAQYSTRIACVTNYTIYDNSDIPFKADKIIIIICSKIITACCRYSLWQLQRNASTAYTEILRIVRPLSSTAIWIQRIHTKLMLEIMYTNVRTRLNNLALINYTVHIVFSWPIVSKIYVETLKWTCDFREERPID